MGVSDFGAFFLCDIAFRLTIFLACEQRMHPFPPISITLFSVMELSRPI